MSGPTLFARAQALRVEISRLTTDVHDLNEFDREVRRLERTYADVFADKGGSLPLLSIRNEIANTRAKLALNEANKRIDAQRIRIRLDEISVLRAVVSAHRKSEGGNGILRKHLDDLESMFNEWDKKTTGPFHLTAAGEITVRSFYASSLRDALETMLIDDAALRAYDHQSPQGIEGLSGYLVGRDVTERILHRFEPTSEQASLTPGPPVFQAKLNEIFAAVTQMRLVAVEVNAGNLQALVAPESKPGTRIPVCCKTMLLTMRRGDRELSDPKTEDREWLTIRYRVPRR
jgi:hypothetical protein